MFGVVLWSDTIDNKAVIWCEDHGDLAYFSGKSELASGRGGEVFATLDAGDLVHFELQEGAKMRHVRNPQLIEQGGHVALGEMLRGQPHEASRSASNLSPKAPSNAAYSAQIIPFARKDDRQSLDTLVAV